MKNFIVTSPKECREVGDRLPPNGSQLLPDFPLTYQGDCEEYERYIDSLPRYPILSSNNYEVGETFDGEINYKCPACGGDGKETCNNPDHSFIDAIGGELSRLGCPVCGHDEKYKVNHGKNVCPECGGLGCVIPEVFEEYGREYGYDEEPVIVIYPVIPVQQEKEEKPQIVSKVKIFETAIREFGIDAALEYFNVPYDNREFFKKELSSSHPLAEHSNDAIDFAEWILKNNWDTSANQKEWVYKLGHGNIRKTATTQQLYNIYKN